MYSESFRILRNRFLGHLNAAIKMLFSTLYSLSKLIYSGKARSVSAQWIFFDSQW